MSQLANLSRLINGRFNRILIKRFVSTSPKNNETAASSTAEVCKTTTSSSDANKNWISYGYDNTSKEADRNAAHSGMFGTVTICLVFGAFFFAYMPDYNLRDWATREAFLELRRREEAGAPLIDPNLIDPGKINLPSDEELGDIEIII